MSMEFLAFVRDIGVTGFLDIAVMSVIIYALIIWFKRSRAFFVLIGIFIVGAIYLLSRELDLKLTAAMFQGFFAVILIALIVIFQEEIKHLFERLAVWSLHRGRPRRTLAFTRQEVEVLVRAVTSLAKEKIGALIVIRGRDVLGRHVNGGIDLNGELSEPILHSIFTPESPTHDGAVVIEDNRIAQFSAHLPLSKDLRKLQKSGTRHAAALGLSELTDAICIVVSEERGTVSVALGGEIDVISDPEKLSLILRRYYEETSPQTAQRAWVDLFRRNVREKLVAIAVTLVLWFFFVQESRPTYKRFYVPVQYTNVPSGLSVSKIRPEQVEVTLSGPRREFYFVNEKRLNLLLDLSDSEVGAELKPILKTNVTTPAKLSVDNVQPNRVRVFISSAPPPAKP